VATAHQVEHIDELGAVGNDGLRHGGSGGKSTLASISAQSGAALRPKSGGKRVDFHARAGVEALADPAGSGLVSAVMPVAVPCCSSARQSAAMAGTPGAWAAAARAWHGAPRAARLAYDVSRQPPAGDPP
jgi:hypothetical protein